MRVQHKYDYYPSRDALGLALDCHCEARQCRSNLSFRLSSPLMGEDKGEGDN